MSFLDLAKKRFSVRNYQARPVEEEKLMQVLEAGRVAPSAVNYQPVHFIVVRNEEIKKKVASTYKRDWLLTAPVIIVVCGDHSRSWRRGDGKDHCDIDAAIAIDHMTLAAVELGLGTCWICAFNSMECHKILGLPSHIEVIALLPLGYPGQEADTERHQTQRKPLDELVSWDKY
ncbi:MAG: nitroreductase family protein [Bacillota bacterium]|jgi:nitroreductase|nr:nitroreductase [Clostridia bacterium]